MKRTDTFQNLLLIMIANGAANSEEKRFIDDLSYQLGITDEEYSYYIKNIQNLSYVIPDNKEDAYQELYKMTLLCLADGELSEDEEQSLYEFASACGFSEEEYKRVLQYIFDQYASKQKETTQANQKVYEQVFATLKETGKTEQEIAQTIRQVIQTKNLNYVFANNEVHNHAFYALLWLIYCRYVKLNSGGLALIAMMLELVEVQKYTLEDILIDLKLSEASAEDGQVLKLLTIPTEPLKNDLANHFPFNK